MSSYLLTWNSEKYDRSAVDIAEHDKWSTGVTRSISEGDRLFFLKFGRQPRGIVASGRAVSKVYRDLVALAYDYRVKRGDS